MKERKNVFFTYFLLFFIAVSVTISFLVVSKLKEEEPMTPKIKTKAANITYKRLIALNPAQPTGSGAVSSDISPTLSPTPSPFLTPTLPPSPTSINLLVSPSPSPTSGETLLAYNQNQTPTASPTRIITLPSSGIFTFSAFLFIFSLLMIFVSLII